MKLMMLSVLICGALLVVPVSAADGDLDTTFNTTGSRVTNVGASADDTAYDVIPMTDGRIVATGYGNGRFGAVRYTAAGLFDTTFSGDGIATSSFVGTGLAGAVQGDGKVLVAGSVGATQVVWRLTSNGIDDTTFDGDGRADLPVAFTPVAVLVNSAGKIIVAGSTGGASSDIVIVQLNADGTIDTTFDGDGVATIGLAPAGNDTVNEAVLTADGKIVVSGWKNDDGAGFSNSMVARINSDGTLDTTFDGDGYVSTPIVAGNNDLARGVAVQSNGKIITTGQYTATGSNNAFIARYNADGSLDSGFDADGVLLVGVTNRRPEDVLVQPDGRIIMTALSGSVTGYELFKYNVNGTLDTSFSLNGRVTGITTDFVNAVALQPDGKLLVAGHRQGTTFDDFVVSRYQNTSLTTTAATVRIAGRILDAYGNGVRGALVFRQSSSGAIFSVRTNTFGRFVFGDIAAGETSIISATTKSTAYSPRIVTASDDVTDLDIYPDFADKVDSFVTGKF